MKKHKRELIIIMALIGGAVLFRVGLALATSSVGGQTTVNTTNLPVQSGHVTIIISSKEYHAATVVITVGTSVTWVNQDPMAHTVTEGQDAWKSGWGQSNDQCSGCSEQSRRAGESVSSLPVDEPDAPCVHYIGKSALWGFRGLGGGSQNLQLVTHRKEMVHLS